MVERHRILRVTVLAVLLSILPAGSATGLKPQSSGRNLSPQSTVLSPESSPQSSPLSPELGPQSSVLSPESLSEPHLANIRQLTAGGKNAEAYFSHDGRKLIFQSTNNWTTGESATWPLSSNEQLGCYQIYVMDLELGRTRLVSTGLGGTTCGYFFPGDRRVLYSSTHLAGLHCPPKPKREGRYRWALDDYDIFSVRVDGQQIQRLTTTKGYDAEATISPDGKTVVFTSVRDGDVDIYTMHLDGTHVQRLTHEIGYDGGAFFSPDNQRIVYRASHPRDPAEIEQYKSLLARNLVEPSQLEIFVMNADGTDKRQVTANGASNFAPFFHPDGRHIIFSSNVHGRGRSFHLYLIRDDGSRLERVTFSGTFNSFPMFSPDGKQLVWVSDRSATKPSEFNLFLADWIP
ncbi:MAG: PD40 domain-containing protein [Nitrospirae bacterium]|nr:PD40 domain-containing protein [Nitrospirota bacterium]